MEVEIVTLDGGYGEIGSGLNGVVGEPVAGRVGGDDRLIVGVGRWSRLRPQKVGSPSACPEGVEPGVGV